MSKIKLVIEVDEKDYKYIKEQIESIRDSLRKGLSVDDVTHIGWVAIAEGKPYVECPEDEYNRGYCDALNDIG